jgi:hypothetical protein
VNTPPSRTATSRLMSTAIETRAWDLERLPATPCRQLT